MEVRRQQRAIVAGITIVVMLVVLTVMPATYASSHHKSDNSTDSSPSTPRSPEKAPTCLSNNGDCGGLSTPQPTPQPTPPSPQTFLCPDGTTINLTITSTCPSSSSQSGSSGSGSSHFSGSGSSSSISKADIKQAVLSCIAGNVTMGMQAVSLNKSQATNQTFLYKVGNSTADCIPGLTHTTSTTTTTHHHKTSSNSSKSILNTLMPATSNNTKIPAPSTLAGHTQDWRIGFEYGTNDGKVGVFDPSVCSPVNDKRITNEFDCGQAYKNGYVTACTAPGNRFSCGDGPTTLK